jgi:hypothetical protein
MRNCNAAGDVPVVAKVIGMVTVEPGSDAPGERLNVAL